MQVDPTTLAAIRSELDSLAALLRDVSLSPAVADRTLLETERRGILRTIDRYLLPRFETPDAPVVVAVVGPGGTGKSTIVNSIAQQRVTAAAALRPTTQVPVVWAGPRQSQELWADAPGSEAPEDHSGPELVVADHPMTAHLTVVDTPPIDYHAEGDVVSSRYVLSLADVCVFVTSPARYADAVGWRFVSEARARGVPTLFVFNRLPRDEHVAASLLRDLATRLHARGLLLSPDPEFIFGDSRRPRA